MEAFVDSFLHIEGLCEDHFRVFYKGLCENHCEAFFKDIRKVEVEVCVMFNNQ